MELLQLKYFCALAQNQHLTKTAEQLMISAPSLSATISKLEESLGVELFDRKGRNIRLNHCGEIFLAHVSRALAELDNAQSEMQAYKKETHYTVHVGMGSLPIWQDALEEFQAQYPNVFLDYYTMSPFDLARTDGEHFGFYLGVKRDIPSADFNILPVRPPEHPMVAMSRMHPLSGEMSINLSQCANETFLTIGSSNRSAHQYILDMCNAAGFTPKKIIEADYFLRLKMLQENRGITITTDLGAKYLYVDPQKVVMIPIEAPVITRTQSIVWRQNKILSAGDKLFMNFIENYYKTH